MQVHNVIMIMVRSGFKDPTVSVWHDGNGYKASVSARNCGSIGFPGFMIGHEAAVEKAFAEFRKAHADKF